MVASGGKVTMVDDGVFYLAMGCRVDGQNIMDTETKANGRRNHNKTSKSRLEMGQ